MRRGVLALFVLLAGGATARAQPLIVQMPPVQMKVVTIEHPLDVASANASAASPDEVVARLMSFDRNGDGVITKDELSERMERVVEQGDISGDGALDAAEVRAIAQRLPEPMIVRGFGGNHYGFADESSQSSRIHLERSLDDIRLASPIRENATGIVLSFAYELDQAALADLLEDLGSLLTLEQFKQFRLTLTQQDSKPIPIASFADQRTVPVFDLERQIEVFQLPEAERVSARLALDRFKSRIRTTEGDRAVLLERLQADLSEEQRDDLRAALARRPVGKALSGIGGGLAGDVVNALVK